MEQRLQFVTLGVADLDRSRRFYVDGLGWTPLADLGEIVFFQVGPGTVMSIFGAEALETDVAGAGAGPVCPGPHPFSLAYACETEDEVRAAHDGAVAAGATSLKAPGRADFGGYHAYVADPDGFRWEFVHGSGFVVDPDGRVTFTGG